MRASLSTVFAGATAGLVNGLFGGGGGMVLLPMLSHKGELPPKKLYPTCIAVICPVCVLSAAVYFLRGGRFLADALPYLAGGLLGGLAGGKLYGKVPPQLLRWLFTGFLFYAGGRYLL